MEEKTAADTIELLICFGLTRQEARVYSLLLMEGSLSGYEAAKRTGISRSNAYGSLAGLVDKGAAYVLEEQPVRYQAVPIREFCTNKLHFLKEAADTLEREIPKEMPEHDHYITIRGRRNVEDKFRNMLREAKKRVYLFVPDSMLRLYRQELEEQVREGHKVVILTEGPYELEGAIVHFTNRGGNFIRLIVDSSYAITGELLDEMHTNCLYSANPNLVKLMKDALANEIRLIQMTETDRR